MVATADPALVTVDLPKLCRLSSVVAPAQESNPLTDRIPLAHTPELTNSVNPLMVRDLLTAKAAETGESLAGH